MATFILNAEPPRESPSILVSIDPVTFTVVAKSVATFIASWPVRLSKTKIVSFGTLSLSIKFNSSRSSLSMFMRPAVSYKTNSILFLDT